MVVVKEVEVEREEDEDSTAFTRAPEFWQMIPDRRQATAATFKAQADFLQANLGYLLAWAELQEAVGITPGL